MLPRSAPSRLYAAIFVPVEPTSIPMRLKNSHSPVKGDDCSSDKPCLCVGSVANPDPDSPDRRDGDSVGHRAPADSPVCL
jgi:hypothetical protein